MQRKLVQVTIWHDEEDLAKMLIFFIEKIGKSNICPIYADKDMEFLGYRFTMSELTLGFFKKEFGISFGD